MSIEDTYEIFDPALEAWATSHRFQVSKLYRDDVVRSIMSHGMRNPEAVGQDPQIWLDWPIVNGRVNVKVAVGRWCHSAPATVRTLAEVLERELELLKSHCMPETVSGS